MKKWTYMNAVLYIVLLSFLLSASASAQINDRRSSSGRIVGNRSAPAYRGSSSRAAETKSSMSAEARKNWEIGARAAKEKAVEEITDAVAKQGEEILKDAKGEASKAASGLSQATAEKNAALQDLQKASRELVEARSNAAARTGTASQMAERESHVLRAEKRAADAFAKVARAEGKESLAKGASKIAAEQVGRQFAKQVVRGVVASVAKVVGRIGNFMIMLDATPTAPREYDEQAVVNSNREFRQSLMSATPGPNLFEDPPSVWEKPGRLSGNIDRPKYSLGQPTHSQSASSPQGSASNRFRIGSVSNPELNSGPSLTGTRPSVWERAGRLSDTTASSKYGLGVKPLVSSGTSSAPQRATSGSKSSSRPSSSSSNRSGDRPTSGSSGTGSSGSRPGRDNTGSREFRPIE